MTNPATAQESLDHVDVLVVGAGLSGIGAAHHLQTRSLDRSYAILEARDAIGGTWDLFRYPGIRSDSDMYTPGYSFRPWTEAEAIADGSASLRHVRETAEEGRTTDRIRFGHRVERAEWSFTSGYVRRGIGRFPEQGAEPPWRLHQSYVRDLLALRFGRLEDGAMEFAA